MESRSCAIADGPRGEMCQSKICQLLYNSVACRNRLYNKSRTNRSNGNRRSVTNSVHPATTHSTVAGVIHTLDRRRLLLTTDLPWRNFLSPEFGAKFQTEVPLFLGYPNFLKTRFKIGQRELPCQNLVLSLQSFRYNTGLLRTDRRTDTPRQHIPAALA